MSQPDQPPRLYPRSRPQVRSWWIALSALLLNCCLSASPAEAQEDAVPPTLIRGQVIVRDLNWRFAYSNERLLPPSATGPAILAARFIKPHYLGVPANSQFVFMSKKDSPHLELLLMYEENKSYYHLSFPIPESLQSYAAATEKRMLVTASLPLGGVYFFDINEQGSLRRYEFDYYHTRILEVELARLPPGTRLLGSAYVTTGEPTKLLTASPNDEQLVTYNVDETNGLTEHTTTELPAQLNRQHLLQGDFLGLKTEQLILPLKDGTPWLWYIPTPDTPPKLMPLNLPFDPWHTLSTRGGFDTGSRHQFIRYIPELKELLLMTIRQDDQPEIRRIPFSPGLEPQELVSASLRRIDRNDLLVFDQNRRNVEVWALDLSAAPTLLGRMNAEAIPSPRGLLLSSTRENLSTVIVYSEGHGWAFSTFNNISPVPSAWVYAGPHHWTQSKENGLYQFDNLPAGDYELQATAPGFTMRPSKKTVHLKAGAQMIVDFESTAPSFRERNVPVPCTGYNDRSNRWGYYPLGSGIFPKCAENSAVLWAQDNSATRQDLQCCPLPSEDILQDEVALVSLTCPEGFVATGPSSKSYEYDKLSYQMECRKLNLERYKLGPKIPGAYWGLGESFRGDKTYFTWEAIPAGIRYALGRNSMREWDVDGCIAEQPGALLVEYNSGNCKEMRFRQLQYRGLPGDPPAGTPVKLFPNCTAITSAFDPAPECRDRQ